jgi:ATP-dependent exoDNAse (exonuclease V) alpha subunit
MKVMVTFNIDTDLDLANGSRGVVVDIILDENEGHVDAASGTVVLRKPPAYILVKLDRTKAKRLAGLEEGVIPLIPSERTFDIVVGRREPKKMRVKRRQYPITPAYAFTDYKSQGQTIPYIIVDIARPPYAGLTLFNIYVALSQSSGRDTIRLLRAYDAVTMVLPLNQALMIEDRRLTKLNEDTKQRWDELRTSTT